MLGHTPPSHLIKLCLLVPPPQDTDPTGRSVLEVWMRRASISRTTFQRMVAAITTGPSAATLAAAAP